MDILEQGYLSWWQFIILFILIALAYFALKRFRKSILWLTGIQNFSFINGILLLLLILCFVLINPIMNGLIVLVGLLISYPVLTSFLRGLAVANNAKIELGDLVSIGDFRGKVSEINLSGIKLVTSSNNLFVPYKIVGEQVIEKYKSDESRYLQFICRAINESDKLTLIDLEKTIFNFPFIEFDASIDIVQLGDDFQVNTTLANERFKNSFFTTLSKAGFSIDQIKTQ